MSSGLFLLGQIAVTGSSLPLCCLIATFDGMAVEALLLRNRLGEIQRVRLLLNSLFPGRFVSYFLRPMVSRARFLASWHIQLKASVVQVPKAL